MTERRLRLALLDASQGAEHTRRNFRREVEADLVEFDVGAGSLPADFAFDGVIVTGSRASVYWDEPWIASLCEWVREAIDRGLPTLGVCFGHQVVADVLGGRVESMGEYEIGYRSVEHFGDELFAGIDSPFTVFVTHSDAVVELPPGAEVTAENEFSNHGFRLGDVFGVQFHPEYDLPTATEVTLQKDELAAERKEAVLDGVTEENARRADEAKLVFENFVSHVRAVAAERAGTGTDPRT